MRVETALIAAMAVLVAASVLVAVAVPGALAGPDEADSRAHLADVTIAADEVTAETVTLTTTAYVDHYGGPSEDLSVRVRVTDLDSELQETTNEVSVEPVSGDREVAVPVNVTVPREGDYRIEVLLYSNDERQESITRTVRGVGSLSPPEQRSPVRFHRFDRQPSADTLPSVQFSVDSATAERVTLDVSTYLTNVRGRETGDLEVEFVLRQAESNVVAARERVDVGEVPPSRTVAPSTTVEVPDGYNYYVDVILWQDGVIVDSTRGTANLDPGNALDVNRSDEESGLQVEDFERDRADGANPSDSAESEDAPGFGFVAALAALLATGTIIRRYQ